MRRRIAYLLVLFAVAASPSHAQGINLAWNNCITQASAAANMNYACDGSRNGNPFKLSRRSWLLRTWGSSWVSRWCWISPRL